MSVSDGYKAYYFSSGTPLDIRRPTLIESNELGSIYMDLDFLKKNCVKGLKTLERDYSSRHTCLITKLSYDGHEQGYLRSILTNGSVVWESWR